MLLLVLYLYVLPSVVALSFMSGRGTAALPGFTRVALGAVNSSESCCEITAAVAARHGPRDRCHTCCMPCLQVCLAGVLERVAPLATCAAGLRRCPLTCAPPRPSVPSSQRPVSVPTSGLRAVLPPTSAWAGPLLQLLLVSDCCIVLGFSVILWRR
jgi:hypothetical protein